jgi:hypothetical protein
MWNFALQPLNERRFRAIVICGFIVSVLLVIFPNLLYYALRIGYAVSIDYNEGWNLIHTARLLNGEPLYLPYTGLPVTPVNYPPLSFFIIGAASYFTDNLLITGRVFSLGALLLIACLIFATIFNLTSSKSSALLGSLLWLLLIIHTSHLFIGMYDPQLLAQVFSTGAFCLSAWWRNHLTVERVWVIAALCCIALFTKHLLVSVPITLAIAFWVSHRRNFWQFALAGLIVSALMFLGCWLYGGEHFLSNFIDFDRPVDNIRRVDKILDLFLGQSLWALFVPFFILLVRSRNKWNPALIYFFVSFILGAYFVGGSAVDTNAWSDLFIAGAILFGLLAANHSFVLRVRNWAVFGGVGLIVAGLVISGYVGSYGMVDATTRYALRCLQLALLAMGTMLLLRRRIAVFIGGGLVLAGLLASEVVMARYMSSDGILQASTISSLRWLQLSLLSSGTILLGRRQLNTALEKLLAHVRSNGSSNLTTLRDLGKAISAYGVLVLGFIPIFTNLIVNLKQTLDYGSLQQLERAHQRDIELLRSIQGPALFENLLIGYEAGKKLFFDPFSGSVLIASGRLPEEILTTAINQKYFAVIVMSSDLEERLAAQRKSKFHWVRPTGYFNGNIIEVIGQNYEMLDTGQRPDDRQRLKTPDRRGDYQNFFYVPRRTEVGHGPVYSTTGEPELTRWLPLLVINTTLTLLSFSRWTRITERIH